jgi:hypothetical protein
MRNHVNPNQHLKQRRRQALVIGAVARVTIRPIAMQILMLMGMIYDNQRPVILKKMRTRLRKTNVTIPIKMKIVIGDPRDPHEQLQPEEE